jgi:hypothetical protein
MLIPVPSEYIKKTPIKFGYLNPNRSFFDGFMETLPAGFIGGDGDRIQLELSEVWDFSQNFNSVNFLTNVRTKFSEGMTTPVLSVFTEEVPIMAEESPEPCFNYWTSFPKTSTIEADSDSYLFRGSIIPLKNNFSEKETVTCGSCYRNYSYFNFGEHQLDTFKPSILFTTNTITQTFDTSEFTFKLPDLSDPINLVDLDFSCFGALAGSCPEEADHIIANGVESWLKGDDCESVWVDRYYGLVGETCLSDSPELESVLFEDINPSQTVLSAGEVYTYKRPLSNKNLNVLTEVCKKDSPEYYGVFGFMSDAGQVNSKQTDAADILYRMGELDGVFFGGDNNYENGDYETIEANWDLFDPYVQIEKVFPAIGNHDIENFDLANPQTDKFDYLPNNKRYYNVMFEDASLELFVLNSGVKSNGSMVEPDGNTVGSLQYQWFIGALGASTAKYRVVMFHHPYVSGMSSATNKVVTEMDWGFDDLPVDLILNGHTHTNQHLRHNNLDILDISATVRDARDMSCSESLYGSNEGVELVWADAIPCESGGPAIASITVTTCSMDICVFDTTTGEGIYSFNIKNNRNSEEVVEECSEENAFDIIFEAEGLVGNILTDGSGNSNDATFVI